MCGSKLARSPPRGRQVPCTRLLHEVDFWHPWAEALRSANRAQPMAEPQKQASQLPEQAGLPTCPGSQLCRACQPRQGQSSAVDLFFAACATCPCPCIVHSARYHSEAFPSTQSQSKVLNQPWQAGQLLPNFSPQSRGRRMRRRKEIMRNRLCKARFQIQVRFPTTSQVPDTRSGSIPCAHFKDEPFCFCHGAIAGCLCSYQTTACEGATSRKGESQQVRLVPCLFTARGPGAAATAKFVSLAVVSPAGPPSHNIMYFDGLQSLFGSLFRRYQ